MSRFKLLSETIEIRGEPVTVHELSSKQKSIWARAVKQDLYCAPYVLASLVCDPPVSAEEAETWPSQIIEQVVSIASRLSGMEDDEEKHAVARAADDVPDGVSARAIAD